MIEVRWDAKKEVVVITGFAKKLLSFSSEDAARIGARWIDYALDPRTQDALSNEILRRRTGHLAGSAKWQLQKRGRGCALVLRSAVYGPIHEFGGVITPKRAQWLTIPLPAAMTPAGVPRGRARDFPDTFIAKSQEGDLVIFQRKADDEVTPLFVLRKKVTIPARRWASISVEESLDQLDRIAQDYFDEKGGA